VWSVSGGSGRRRRPRPPAGERGGAESDGTAGSSAAAIGAGSTAGSKAGSTSAFALALVLALGAWPFGASSWPFLGRRRRPPPPAAPLRRFRRSSFGRGRVGRARARTRASVRRSPNSDDPGSSSTSTSRSLASIPRASRARSRASSTVRPVVTTHCTGALPLLPLLLLRRRLVPPGLGPPVAGSGRGSVGGLRPTALRGRGLRAGGLAGRTRALALLEVLHGPGLVGRLAGLGSEGVLAAVEGLGDVALQADAVDA